MNKKYILIVLVLAVAAGAGIFWLSTEEIMPPIVFSGRARKVFEEINNFEECVDAGYPVMESYPRQCKTPEGKTFVEEHCAKEGTVHTMTLTDAKEIAIHSECGDQLKDTYFCNENTGTWWMDLKIEKEGCNPACVVNIVTREAEINWRCAGLLLP